jgi:Flp pilus assembly protein TadD
MAEGRIEEAERYLKAAWVLGPSNAAVAIALARALDGLGRSYEAQQWFTKAAHIHG